MRRLNGVGRLAAGAGLALLTMTMLTDTTIAADHAAREIMLRDVHPLHGGRNLFIGADGTAVIQVVGRQPGEVRLIERRWARSLPPPVVRPIFDLADRLPPPVADPKSGRPDAARIAITVLGGDGRAETYGKWLHDRDVDLDPLYDVLSATAETMAVGPPLYEGPYDPAWRPPGF